MQCVGQPVPSGAGCLHPKAERTAAAGVHNTAIMSKVKHTRKSIGIESRKDSFRLVRERSGRLHIPVKWTACLTRMVGDGSTQLASLAHLLVAWSPFGMGGSTRIDRATVAKWFGKDADRKITRSLRSLVEKGVVDSIDCVDGKSVKVRVNREVARTVREERQFYAADVDFGMLDYNEDCVANSRLSTRVVLLVSRSLDKTGSARGLDTASMCTRDGSDTCAAAPRVALISKITGLSEATVYRAFKDAARTRLFSVDKVYLCRDGKVRTEAKSVGYSKKEHLGSVVTRLNPIAMVSHGISLLKKKAVALYYAAIEGDGSSGLSATVDRWLDRMDGPNVGSVYRKLKTRVSNMYRMVFGTDGSAAFFRP